MIQKIKLQDLSKDDVFKFHRFGKIFKLISIMHSKNLLHEYKLQCVSKGVMYIGYFESPKRCGNSYRDDVHVYLLSDYVDIYDRPKNKLYKIGGEKNYEN